MQRARHHRADDHRPDVGLGIAFQRQELVQPDRILVRGPPRIGRDPPARANRAILDQGEDEVGVPGVDGKQHGSVLAGRDWLGESGRVAVKGPLARPAHRSSFKETGARR